MRKHDQEYKKLFSNREMLKTLLESFVPEPWVQTLDFSKAERVEKSFITKGLKEREADLIWKVGLKGEEVYIYLLLEFQSSVDYFMALRVLRYICEFYQSLVDEGKYKVGQRLPAVFPLVLYNGNESWTAPERIEELIVPTVGQQHIPKFQYFKLAENEYSKDFLLQLANSVAVVFFTENADPGSLHESLNWLIEVLKKEDETVAVLMSNFIVRLYQQTETVEVMSELKERTVALKEVRQLFEANYERWKAKIADETAQYYLNVEIPKARNEGRFEGRVEGLEIGEDKLKQVAQRMKEARFDIKTISQMTGLSEEEIEKL